MENLGGSILISLCCFKKVDLWLQLKHLDFFAIILCFIISLAFWILHVTFLQLKE